MTQARDYCKYVDVFYGNGELDHYPKDNYVKSVWFNGQRLEDYQIKTDTLMNGGTLVFEMTGKP